MTIINGLLFSLFNLFWVTLWFHINRQEKKSKKNMIIWIVMINAKFRVLFPINLSFSIAVKKRRNFQTRSAAKQILPLCVVFDVNILISWYTLPTQRNDDTWKWTQTNNYIHSAQTLCLTASRTCEKKRLVREMNTKTEWFYTV